MKIIASIVVAVCLVACGWALARWLTEPVIKIKKVTVTETRYIRPAETERELRDCYESPITIEAEMRDNSMYITAGDACKHARAQVVLDCEPRPIDPRKTIKSHAIIGGCGVVIGVVVGVAAGITVPPVGILGVLAL